MAAGHVTIKDPSGTIPDVTFSPKIGGHKRQLQQRVSVRGFTQSGKAILQGATTEQRYEWSEVSGLVDLATLARFDAMAIASDNLFGDGSDGFLYLEDEIRYVFPAATPHPKTLITPLAAGFAGQVWGFGRFKIQLVLAEDHGEYQGYQNGERQYLIKFAAVELL